MPADRTRAHVDRLRARRVGWKTIADRSGVSVATLKALFGVADRPPTVMVRSSVEAAVLAVAPIPAPSALVDSSRTWQRIDWLLANGWTLAGLTAELGLTDLRRRPKVTQATAEAVRALHLEEKEARRRARGCRLPVAPLEARLCAHLDRAGVHTQYGESVDPNLASMDELAELVGVTSRTWKRWRDEGVPLVRADRAAVAVGHHPLDIWPDFHSRVAGSPQGVDS